MKIFLIFALLAALAMPCEGFSYPSESRENCEKHRDDSRQIDGTCGSVIMGERPFLTFIMENGDELLMVPENAESLASFRENEGKKIRATYRRGNIFLEDDLEDGSGECVDSYYFEYGMVLGGNSPEAAGD